MLDCVMEHGRIYIRHGEPAYNEPTLIIRYWPTRFGRHELESFSPDVPNNMPDQIVVREGSSQRYGYSLKFPGMGVWADCPLAGDSRCERIEQQPIPCPKVRAGIDVRYRDGRWQKCLKTGWTNA